MNNTIKSLNGLGFSWDSVLNTVQSTVNTGVDVANQVATAQKQFTPAPTQAQNSGPVYAPSYASSSPGSYSSGSKLSTTAKVAIGVAGAGLLTAIIYMALPKKKKA
jgi:hypothetical protein